ncbi:hypothetical protein FQR65_LT13768 [Abscondita terminalis]|nr:hypothetical protein FQR65_LT13768 [Abscondita terminalis]
MSVKGQSNQPKTLAGLLQTPAPAPEIRDPSESTLFGPLSGGTLWRRWILIAGGHHVQVGGAVRHPKTANAEDMRHHPNQRTCSKIPNFVSGVMQHVTHCLIYTKTSRQCLPPAGKPSGTEKTRDLKPQLGHRSCNDPMTTVRQNFTSTLVFALNTTTRCQSPPVHQPAFLTLEGKLRPQMNVHPRPEGDHLKTTHSSPHDHAPSKDDKTPCGKQEEITKKPQDQKQKCPKG